MGLESTLVVLIGGITPEVPLADCRPAPPVAYRSCWELVPSHDWLWLAGFGGMLAYMQVWTIEVADGASVTSAGSWRRAHGEWLVEAALSHGAKEWTWVVRPWGVLLELSFDDEADWLRFRATPAVQAALDAAPDPVNGLWVYIGRGGSSVSPARRRPRPVRSSDGAPLPEPELQPEPWQQPLGRRTARMSRASQVLQWDGDRVPTQ